MIIAQSERYGSLAIAVIAFLLPPLTVFAPLGTAPLLVTAAVAALALTGWRLREAFVTLAPLAALLGALGIWATLSSLWSIIPAHSVFEGLRFLGESACGLTLVAASLSISGDDRRRIARALAWGIALALIFLAIERFGGAPIERWWHSAAADQPVFLGRYDRGVTVLALLIWPMAIAEIGRAARAALIALSVVATALLISTTALLAALIGLGVFAVARLAPRVIAGAMIAGIIALGIAIPIATPSDSTVLALHQEAPWIKWSGIHRLLIWRFGADRVAERPLLGWGMDSSRAMPGGKTDFNDLLPTLHYPGGAEALPLHPHDATLQWQLELGIPGLFLGLAVVTWLIYRIGWRRDRPGAERAAALALAAAALVIGLLSFGIWQAWWESTLWLAASLLVANSAGATLPQSAPRQQRDQAGTQRIGS